MTMLPASSSTPPGVEPERWAAIHWLPPGLVELSVFSRDQAGMVQWLRAQVPELAPDEPACTRALDGVERVLMLRSKQGGANAPGFIGSFQPIDVEACVIAAMPALGGRVGLDGPHMVLELDDARVWLAWAQLGTSTILVVDSDRELLDRLLEAQPDRLADDVDLVPLIAALEPGWPESWIVGRIEYSTALLGVPGLGTMMQLDLDRARDHSRVLLEMAYASTEDAARARDGIDGMLVELRRDVGIDLQADCETLEEGPSLRCMLVMPSGSDPGGIERLVKWVEVRVARAERGPVP